MPKRKTHSQKYSSEAAKVVRQGKKSRLFSRTQIKEWITRHKEVRDELKKFDK